MISLRDEILIETSPADIGTWFEALPDHYRAWHPDHVACRFFKGSMWQVGSVLEAEEYLHGKLHRLRFVMTEAAPGSRLAYKIPGMGWGSFNFRPVGEAVAFEAELHLGSRVPLIGTIADLILRRFFQDRIKAMQQHMQEEGENLKRILEREPAQTV